MSMRFALEGLPEAMRKQVQEKLKVALVRTHIIKDAAPTPKRGAARSALETMLEARMAAANITGYQTEYRSLPNRKYRLDFAWPEKKLGVEVQGQVHRIKQRFDDDIDKRALHILAGWRIIEVHRRAIQDGSAVEWIKALLSAKP